jgi:hypothetical protein
MRKIKHEIKQEPSPVRAVRETWQGVAILPKKGRKKMTRNNRYPASSRGRNIPERDEEGRFMSGERSSRSPGRGSYDHDDDYRSSSSRQGRGQSGWFGDMESYSDTAQRGREERQSSYGGRQDYGEDDDRFSPRQGRDRGEREERPSSQMRGGRRDYNEEDDYRASRMSRERGHSGWFGDQEGHSEAARRGWEDRR